MHTSKAGPGPDRKENHSVKEHLEELLAQSLLHLQREDVLPAETELEIQLERTRSPEHGEFASNLAMVLAKPAGMPPRELAQQIIDRIPKSRQVERMEIAGPGFINFFLQRCALTGVIKDAVRLFQPVAHAAVWFAAGDVQNLELVESRRDSGEGRSVRAAVAELGPVGCTGGWPVGGS